MKQWEEFITAFRLLGEDFELKAELIVALESFVWHLYRYKDTDINIVQKKMFDKKFVKEEKVTVYHCCHLASPHYICTSCTPTVLQGFGNVPYSM